MWGITVYIMDEANTEEGAVKDVLRMRAMLHIVLYNNALPKSIHAQVYPEAQGRMERVTREGGTLQGEIQQLLAHE